MEIPLQIHPDNLWTISEEQYLYDIYVWGYGKEEGERRIRQLKLDRLIKELLDVNPSLQVAGSNFLDEG